MGRLHNRRSSDIQVPSDASALLSACVLDFPSAGGCILDQNGIVQLFNGEFLHLYRLSPDAIHAGVAFEAVVRDAVEKGVLLQPAANELCCAIRKGLRGDQPFKVRVHLADGRTLDVQHSLLSPRTWLAVHEDVTISRRLEAELQLQIRCLNHALSNMSQGLCLFGPDERLIMRNEQYCQIYGIDPNFVKPGISHRQIIEHWIACGNQPGMSAQELYEKRMREIRSQDVRVGRLVRRDGRIIEAISRITPEGGWVSTNEDITDRCNAEAQIWHLARHDALTKLPNRILFRERMTEALERVLNQSETVSLFVIDLDNFKAINDRLGHTGGDELLAIVAKRIARCLRSGDTAARLGGDEFVVLLGTGSPDAAAKLACRIIDRASQPIVLNNQEIEPGLSIGIAQAPLDGISEAALMKCADIALYRCKDAGRRTFRFFDETTDQCMRAKYAPRETIRCRAETSEMEAKSRRSRRTRRETAAA